ncbi:MAG: hypothetical protein CYPHOPRED_002515 [Cyphobasidiales sp. Tagirdzhanova-0007]|nr:MAG: hypothetical protein CYPHOPRED_002515 [Cyphobasidiales sp. Tagirdzhanova-0007]
MDNSAASIPRFATCQPGDESYRVPGVLQVTSEDVATLAAIAIMFVVILIGWNFVLIRYALYPLKWLQMLVLLIHEGGHVVVGVLTGNQLERVYTDPADGGLCVWATRYPLVAIPFGYLASILVGCAFILCGFNTLASKVASFFIGLLFVVVTYNVLNSPFGLVLVAVSLGKSHVPPSQQLIN